MRVDDLIDFNKKKRFTTTRPPSNPLNPVYKLPYTEPVPVVVNNFIRD